MNTKSIAIAAVAATLMVISAPATVLAEAASGGGVGSSSSAGSHGVEGAGTHGFRSAYHNVEHGSSKRCDILRKRAQWSNAHYWWRKYSRCIGN